MNNNNLPPLHLQFYSGEDKSSNGDVEDRIIQYISDNEPERYSDIFKVDDEWTVFYHLTHFRKNLLNWFHFDSNSSLLEIGAGMGGLTSLFCERCGHVTAVELSKKRATAIQLRCRNYQNLDIFVGDYTNMHFDRKFDYITLIDVLEHKNIYNQENIQQPDFFSIIKKHLAPGGKLIFAIENKYGLKNWAYEDGNHSGVLYNSLNNLAIGNSTQIYDRQKLSDLLGKAGFVNQKFYYPLPDHKLPRIIYTDDFISYDLNSQAWPLYNCRNNQGDIVDLVDKYKVRDSVIRNNVFPFFANSFLVECSVEEVQFDDTLFASIQGPRVETSRIITRFDGKEFVKEAFSADAQSHIKGCYENIVELQNRSIPVVAHKYHNNKIFTDNMLYETGEQRFIKLLQDNDIQGAKELLVKLYDYIILSSEESNVKEYPKADFGVVLENVFLDLSLHNSFYMDDQLHFFDQEWKSHDLPAGYVFFRALNYIYSNNVFLEEMYPLQNWKDQFDLNHVWDTYLSIENSFMQEVICTDFIIIDKLSHASEDMDRKNQKSGQFEGGLISRLKASLRKLKTKLHSIY